QQWGVPMVMSAARRDGPSGHTSARLQAAPDDAIGDAPSVADIRPPARDANNDALVDEAIEHLAQAQRDTSASWAQDVFEKAIELPGRSRYVDASEQRRLVGLVVHAAEHMERPQYRHPARLCSSWWFGSRIERAWALLHEAELECLWHVDESRVVWE